MFLVVNLLYQALGKAVCRANCEPFILTQVSLPKKSHLCYLRSAPKLYFCIQLIACMVIWEFCAQVTMLYLFCRTQATRLRRLRLYDWNECSDARESP